MPAGCLAAGLFFALLFVLPVFLAEAALAALGRLGLSAEASVLVALGVLFGGAVHLPVKRAHTPAEPARPASLFGLSPIQAGARRRETVIAVNLGGCVIPCALALYELGRLAVAGAGPLAAALAATAVNVFVCHRLSRPVEGLGIAMPPLIPALAAAACALLIAPEHAPPVAFVAGVAGPLVGADLLRLREIERLGTTVASIGGAGTFDGIVISGLAATLLAPAA